MNIEQIPEQLFDPRPQEREAAWRYTADALKLTRIGYPFARPPELVIAQLYQDHPERRDALYRWVFERPHEVFSRAYERLLRHPEPRVRLEALMASWRWSVPAHRVLIEQLRPQIMATLRVPDDLITFGAAMMWGMALGGGEAAWAAAAQSVIQNRESLHRALRRALDPPPALDHLAIWSVPAVAAEGLRQALMQASQQPLHNLIAAEDDAPLLRLFEAIEVAARWHTPEVWAEHDAPLLARMLAEHLRDDPHNLSLCPKSGRPGEVVTLARQRLGAEA